MVKKLLQKLRIKKSNILESSIGEASRRPETMIYIIKYLSLPEKKKASLLSKKTNLLYRFHIDKLHFKHSKITKIKKYLKRFRHIKNIKIDDHIRKANKFKDLMKTINIEFKYPMTIKLKYNQTTPYGNIRLIGGGHRLYMNSECDFLRENRGKFRLKVNGELLQRNYYFYHFRNQGINEVELIIEKELTSVKGMFAECNNLVDISDLSKLDVSNVSDFSYMFYMYTHITDISAVKNWNVEKGTDFSFMFYHCNKIKNIDALQNWNVSSSNNFCSMFERCTLINNLKPLTMWNVGNCKDFKSMFFNCSNIKDISPLRLWKLDSSNVIHYMLCKCLDANNNDTSEKIDQNKN